MRTFYKVVRPNLSSFYGVECDGGRPLGTLSEIEAWKAKAAAYDTANREWHCTPKGRNICTPDARHADLDCLWIRPVPEIEETG